MAWAPSETARARKHIAEIRTQKFCIGRKERNPLTKDLHHAVNALSRELYTKDAHFLMELIQVYDYIYHDIIYLRILVRIPVNMLQQYMNYEIICHPECGR